VKHNYVYVCSGCGRHESVAVDGVWKLREKFMPPGWESRTEPRNPFPVTICPACRKEKENE